MTDIERYQVRRTMALEVLVAMVGSEKMLTSSELAATSADVDFSEAMSRYAVRIADALINALGPEPTE